VVYLALPEAGRARLPRLAVAGTAGEYVLHGLAIRDASPHTGRGLPALPLLLGGTGRPEVP